MLAASVLRSTSAATGTITSIGFARASPSRRTTSVLYTVAASAPISAAASVPAWNSPESS